MNNRRTELFPVPMRKRPWNLIDVPVYSLVTRNGDETNMNLCTYVTAISLKPKRYVVGVFKDSCTYDRMRTSDKAVLQFLGKDNLPQCRLLGLKSGRRVDKTALLNKKKLLDEWNGFPILKNCAAVVLLRKRSMTSAGDHDLVLFNVMEAVSFHDDVLMLNDLRAAKMIRI